MTITVIDLMFAVLGFILCGALAAYTKWYVKMYCMDNPEIIWIWLDDDEPHGGYRVKEKRFVKVLGTNLQPVPCI